VYGGTGATGSAPEGHVSSSDAGQGGVQFHSQDGAERELRGQQERPAHSGAQVDKRELVDWGRGLRSAPTHNHLSKDGGGNAEVSRIVPVGAAPAFEVAASNQAAGAHPELEVEGMAHKAIFYGQAR
jgi:hypothetical protein